MSISQDAKSAADKKASPAAAPAVRPVARLASIDAYRGFVMLLMMGEVLELAQVAERLPESKFWAFLAHNQQHAAWAACSLRDCIPKAIVLAKAPVTWTGLSLHDLIQPSFSFLVGVALPFSIASRLARGQSMLAMSVHAFVRALILIAMGIGLRSMWHGHTNFTFEDTLTQIGLGYSFLFLLGFRPARDHWIAFVVILLGYWAAFAAYPLPGPDFDYKKAGVTEKWRKEQDFSGFAAHWNKNTNLAWAADIWFMNLFPRPTVKVNENGVEVEKPRLFTNNGGGYCTLNFIPTLATMILGLIAGGILRSDRKDRFKIAWFLAAGAISIALALLIDTLGLCPIVKVIWTPTWVLFSGGCCFLLLTFFYSIMDVAKVRFWAFPLMVIGMNSIAAYCMSWILRGVVADSVSSHLGWWLLPWLGHRLGEAYLPLLHGAAVLLVFWLILFWMYRQKIFIRV